MEIESVDPIQKRPQISGDIEILVTTPLGRPDLEDDRNHAEAAIASLRPGTRVGSWTIDNSNSSRLPELTASRQDFR